MLQPTFYEGGGRTISSCVGISIHDPDELGFRPNSINAQLLRDAEVVVIAEATASPLIGIIQAIDSLNQRLLPSR